MKKPTILKLMYQDDRQGYSKVMVSACCGAPIRNAAAAGLPDPKGGYECAGCGKHCFREGDFKRIKDLPVRTISRRVAHQKILDNDGLIFAVTFRKKNGTFRKLVGRTQVHKGVTGKGLRYNPGERGLIVVYDFQRRGYRMVNLRTIICLYISGRKFRVK